MSDIKKTPPPAGQDREPRKEEHLSYDLHNPTRARRVIYDGIDGKIITVDSEATVKNVRLHADVVKELNDRNALHPGSDLRTRLHAPASNEKTDA